MDRDMKRHASFVDDFGVEVYRFRYGTGMGTLLAGTGLALLAKQRTEPGKEP